MPMLPSEPCIYPPDLLDDTDSIRQDRHWYVIKTRARNEKAIARQLHHHQVPFYLPLTSKRSIIRGRHFISYVPLFSTYMFVLAREPERGLAMKTNRVACCFQAVAEEKLLFDLRQVHRIADSGLPVQAENNLAPGEPVVIRTGPLTGLHGTIVRTLNEQRFVVQVDFIQQGASIELDRDSLASLEPCTPEALGVGGR